MNRTMSTLAAASMVAAFSAAVPAAGAMPTFRDIEMRHDPFDALRIGTQAIAQAVRPGMPASIAPSTLVAAGAECKQSEKNHDVVSCVYDESTIVDDIMTDVQWRVDLGIAGQQVGTITVARNVDGAPTT